MKRLFYVCCFWILHSVFILVNWLTKGTGFGINIMCKICEINTKIIMALAKE